MFTKIFCQMKQNSLKMNTLFNSEAYCGCFARNFDF